MTGGSTIPINYQPGNTATSVNMFFEKLTPSQKASIKTVNTDMSKSYIPAVKRCLPHAKIIIDKFHLLSELNRDIEIVRRQMLNRMKEKENKINQHMIFTKKNTKYKELLNTKEKHAIRWAVIKRPGNLTDYQSRILKKLEQWNMPLYKAYLLKEQFYSLLVPQEKEIAESNLRLWMKEALDTKISGLSSFCKTVESHMPYILNYFESGRTSGAIEGVNNKIKVIKRMAYGYKNTDYFFRKVRAKFVCLTELHNLFTGT